MRITEKNQYIVDYPGINKVEENISEYVDIFNQYGLLCFRGARLDDEEAVLVLDVMSKHFSWTPYSINTKNNGPTWKYTQNYDSTIAVDESLSLDESNNLMINRWHTEGVYSKNPHRAAGWNMRNFKCDSKFGQTGFVDASEIVKDMPSELVEFLRSAELMHYPPIPMVVSTSPSALMQWSPIPPAQTNGILRLRVRTSLMKSSAVKAPVWPPIDEFSKFNPSTPAEAARRANSVL
jgi:hypothetical protein